MFEQLELHADLCNALGDMGFTAPTSIQSSVIPKAMEGRDILLQRLQIHKTIR